MSYSTDSVNLPNNIFRNIEGYARSEESTGRDLYIRALDDLHTTDTGDFYLVSGADLIQLSLLRLLHTPPHGYARWVRTKDGLAFVNSDYQNSIYNYLSSPNSLANKIDVENELKNTLVKETRIDILSVELNIQDNFSSINIDVSYRIKGEAELKQIRAELTSEYV